MTPEERYVAMVRVMFGHDGCPRQSSKGFEHCPSPSRRFPALSLVDYREQK
jgi:hypothetical protein